MGNGVEERGGDTSITVPVVASALADKLAAKVKMKKGKYLASVLEWIDSQNSQTIRLLTAGLLEDDERNVLESLVNELRRRDGLPPCPPADPQQGGKKRARGAIITGNKVERVG